MGGWVRGITLNNKFTISGSGVIDSFNSGNSLYSTNGVYDFAHHLTHGDVGTADSSGSGISGGAHLYGSLAYSGPAVNGANQTTVSGNISTPFNPTIPGTFDPVAKPGNAGWTWTNTLPVMNDNWGPATAINLTGGNSLPKDSNNNTVTSVTATSTDPTAPTLLSARVLSQRHHRLPSIRLTTIRTIQSHRDLGKREYTTSGSGIVNQAAGTKVTWIVDNDITTSGNAYSNAWGTALQHAFLQPSGAQNAVARGRVRTRSPFPARPIG